VAIVAELVALRAAGKFGLKSEGSGELEGSGVTDALIDPVCGMSVSPSAAGYRGEYAGRVWYFCGPDCRRRFKEAPERYVAAARSNED
jgi:Cu+-exporting ATPase